MTTYQKLRVLGEGGMGVVHEALQVDLGRRVALKELKPGAQASREARNRFRREIRDLVEIRDPSLITVYDFDLDGFLRTSRLTNAFDLEYDRPTREGFIAIRFQIVTEVTLEE